MPSSYQVRVYFLPYEDNWTRLRLMASPPQNETGAAGIARRVLYRNASLTNLAHAKAKPADRPALFQSLVNSAMAKHSFFGMESLYLSLLADPTVRALPACAQSLLLWHGRVALDSADEGAFFFNERADRLAYLSPATVKTLKANGTNASIVDSRDSLAVHVESIADAIYNHPFSASSIAPTSSKVSAEKIKAITDDLTLLTAVEGGAAAILAAIPGGQAGAAAFALGAVITGGLAATMPYVEKLTAANSVATSVDGTPPNGAPVCGPDGQPEGTFNGEPENDELGGDGRMSGGGGAGGGSGGGDTRGDGAGAGDESGDDGGDEDEEEGDDCFAAGTPILMADGTLKDIAQISVGDHVHWTDPVTRVSGITHVVSVHASVARRTWQLTLEDGAVLLTTARQPFLHWSTQSFVKAAALSSHEELHSLDVNGKVIPAKLSSVERSAVPRTVYSLHTSPVDHFIVGVARIPVKKKE